MQLSTSLAFSGQEAKTLRYALCQKNVKQAEVGPYDKNQYFVMIKLTDTATKEFATLTGSNIDIRLTILAGDVVVTSAIIQDAIESGSIGSSSMSEQEALKLQKFILNNAEYPCGLIK
jgi:preprotein translocase subunit SecD